MKILTLSDEECPALWDFYTPGRLSGYDLILSCGDLNAKYLSFLVTMARCPVLYVHGNHDVNYDIVPPEGCDCIDDHIVTYNGLRILGLGGCRRYHRGPHQYTDNEMRLRILKLRRKIQRLGGIDIVVTHAPPEGLGDADDIAHWGFESLRELLDKYRLNAWATGAGLSAVNASLTKIINAYERYTIEVPDREVRIRDLGQVIYKTRVRHHEDHSLILR